MTRYQATLFDLDGTIVDGRRGIVRSLHHALSRFGIQRDENALLEFIGPPLHEVFTDGFGFSAARALEAVDAYREYYGERGIYEAETYAGVPSLLEQLHAAGVTLALATSKPHVYARRILAHFDLLDLFDCVSGPELDGTRRHKPEIIDHVLDRLGEPPRETAVMIGDRMYDVAGARHSGLAAITVGWGFGSAQELDAARADHHADNVEQLAALLSAR